LAKSAENKLESKEMLTYLLKMIEQKTGLKNILEPPKITDDIKIPVGLIDMPKDPHIERALSTFKKPTLQQSEIETHEMFEHQPETHLIMKPEKLDELLHEIKEITEKENIAIENNDEEHMQELNDMRENLEYEYENLKKKINERARELTDLIKSNKDKNLSQELIRINSILARHQVKKAQGVKFYKDPRRTINKTKIEHGNLMKKLNDILKVEKMELQKYKKTSGSGIGAGFFSNLGNILKGVFNKIINFGKNLFTRPGMLQKTVSTVSDVVKGVKDVVSDIKQNKSADQIIGDIGKLATNAPAIGNVIREGLKSSDPKEIMKEHSANGIYGAGKNIDQLLINSKNNQKNLNKLKKFTKLS
jgi:hypothetical protein